MNKALQRTTLALALVAAAGAAQAQLKPTVGPYAVAAVGRTQYDHDCWFWSIDCQNVRATFGKVGGGYRFGVFGVEGWWQDYGRSDVRPEPDKLRLSALAANAVWYASFGPQVEGLLRAGVADVRQERSRDKTKSTFSGLFGLGLVIHLAPAVGLEFAWDITGGEGTDSGSTTANALSVGLRVKF